MCRGRILLIGLAAISLALSGTVDARQRSFGIFGAFFGGIAGGHHYHRYHHHRIVQPDDQAPSQGTETGPQTTEEAPQTQPASGEGVLQRKERGATQVRATERMPAEESQRIQVPPPPANLSHLPLADFASIDEDFFGYVFVPSSYDTKLWSHGERDMIQTVFTKGSTSAPNCSQQGAERGAPLIERAEQATHPNQEQHAALEELQLALNKAFEQIRMTCRDVAPIAPTARLKAMQERLFAIRNAGLTIRASLAKFYDSLTEERESALWIR